MGPITLTWIAAIIFSGLVFWGVNVPTGKRTPALYWVTGALIVFHILTQSYLFRVDPSPTASAAAKRTAAEAMVKFESFLTATAVGPGKLYYHSPSGWYRIVSSSFLHYGWIHLIFNAWFFVLFGHVLEHAFGARKFLGVVAAGLIIPPALDGFFPLGLSRVDVQFTGGFSGVVYAVMGAYLVCFPNSRAYGAVNYDLRFWAAVLFLLLPITMVTRFAGVALTETVIIMGIVAAFLLIQPEHARISAPVITVMLYKLLQDILLLEPATRQVFSNSVWRIGGGFAVGLCGGFALNGIRGWRLRWGDETREGAKLKHNTRARMSVARLEAEGRKSAEGARVYLGQRVFVGDAERATAFYREVVMPKFPDVALPLQEQLALARLLHFKGHEVEALHAYETLLKQQPLPEEYSVARLKAAELIIKLAPERSQRARELLDKFEQGHITMVRDRVEAQRLRALLPVVESVSAESRVMKDSEQGAVAAAYVETGPGAPAASVRRSRRGPLKNGEGGESPEGAFEVPRVRPKTFVFVPGATPVSLRHKTHTDESEEPELSEEELLRMHWKPLPCIVEKKPLPTSVLDRRVKNPRLADEDDKPTMYGGKTAAGLDRRGGGRLSQLELVRMDTDLPAAREMPTQYGGLDDVTQSAEMAVPFQRIKLRGEKEPAGEISQTRRARRQNGEADQGPLMQWGERIQPTSLPEADVPSAEYGEAPAVNPEKKSEDGWAVLLVDPEQADVAKQMKAEHHALTEKYGARDYSEVSGAGFQPLFVFRNVPAEQKEAVQEACDAAGLLVRFVSESDPIITMEPVEVVGITTDRRGCLLKTAYGSRRVAWEELSLVSLCDIRLTPNSRALHRLVLELVILKGKPQRFQVFERTVSVKGSSVAGELPSDARELLERVWEMAREKAITSRIYPKAAGAATYPVFESYAWYNEEVLRLLVLG